MRFSRSILLFSATILASTLSFATTNNFSTTLHPAGNNAMLLHPPVDVSIINATNDYIYATIPNTSVYDRIAPGYNDHLYGYDANMWYLPVVIKNAFSQPIYNTSVCRLAIITVYGVAPNYRINTDNDLCS